MLQQAMLLLASSSFSSVLSADAYSVDAGTITVTATSSIDLSDGVFGVEYGPQSGGIYELFKNIRGAVASQSIDIGLLNGILPGESYLVRDYYNLDDEDPVNTRVYGDEFVIPVPSSVLAASRGTYTVTGQSATLSSAGGGLALEGTPVHDNVTSGSSRVLPAFTTTKAAQIFIALTINGATVTSITGGGLTWTSRRSLTGTVIELWTAQATGALSGVQFTVNFSGAVSYATSDVFAFSGQDTSTKWDANAAVPSDGTNDPGTISTNNANDVIIFACRMNTQSTPTQGNIGGSAATKISGADYQLVEYRIVSSTLSSANCTIGTGSGDGVRWITDALMKA